MWPSRGSFVERKRAGLRDRMRRLRATQDKPINLKFCRTMQTKKAPASDGGFEV
jgi:hypothetical protein